MQVLISRLLVTHTSQERALAAAVRAGQHDAITRVSRHVTLSDDHLAASHARQAARHEPWRWWLLCE